MKTFHIITYRQLFALLTLGFGSVCMAHAEVNSSSTQQVNGLSSGAQTEENKDENLLDQIQDGLMQPQRFSPSSPTNRLFHQPSKQKIRLGLTVNKRKSVIGPIVHLEKLIIGLVKLTHKNPRQPPFES